MSEFDQLVENFLQPRGALNIETLVSLVEEVMSEGSGLPLILEREVEATKKLTVTMPVIRISEKMWGKEGSADREVIQSLLGRIVTQGNTLTEKIQFINKFLTSPPTTTDISEILTNIVLLDTLTNIMVHFNASAAGFTFEGFLSALLAGKQVPAGTAGIQDLIDNDSNPISLKLLTEKPGDVHGSYRDLVDHFVDPEAGTGNKRSQQFTIDPETGEQVENPYYVGQAGVGGKMTYVVALKSFREKEASEKLKGKEHIRFFQFDFSAQTFFDSLVSSNHNIPLLLLPQDLGATADVGTGETEDEVATHFLDDEAFNSLRASGPGSRKVYNDIIKTYDSSYINDLKNDIELRQQGKRMSMYHKDTEALVTNKTVQLPPADPRRRKAASQSHQGYRGYKDSVALLRQALGKSEGDFWQLITKTSGYRGSANETQFVISANYYKEKNYDQDGFGFVGIIHVGREAVTELAQKYADVLNQEIFDMFKMVETLGNQINSYFVAGDKPKAIEAAKTATQIKTGTEEFAARDKK